MTRKTVDWLNKTIGLNSCGVAAAAAERERRKTTEESE